MPAKNKPSSTRRLLASARRTDQEMVEAIAEGASDEEIAQLVQEVKRRDKIRQRLLELDRKFPVKPLEEVLCAGPSQ